MKIYLKTTSKSSLRYSSVIEEKIVKITPQLTIIKIKNGLEFTVVNDEIEKMGRLILKLHINRILIEVRLQ